MFTWPDKLIGITKGISWPEYLEGCARRLKNSPKRTLTDADLRRHAEQIQGVARKLARLVADFERQFPNESIDYRVHDEVREKIAVSNDPEAIERGLDPYALTQALAGLDVLMEAHIERRHGKGGRPKLFREPWLLQEIARAFDAVGLPVSDRQDSDFVRVVDHLYGMAGVTTDPTEHHIADLKEQGKNPGIF